MMAEAILSVTSSAGIKTSLSALFTRARTHTHTHMYVCAYIIRTYFERDHQRSNPDIPLRPIYTHT